MASNIRVIHAREFIKAAPDGHLDVERAKAALLELATEAGPANSFEVLLDTRYTVSNLSVADLWNIAAELGRLRSTFSRRTAVLCPLDRFDRAAFMAYCAREQGLNIRAFTSFEDAIEWLFSESP